MSWVPTLICLLTGISLMPAAAADSWEWKPFEPVVQPPVPGLSHGQEAFTSVDAFLMATQGPANLRFRPPAHPQILLRRLYLDLIGLVPTPEERASFLNDPSPQAYENRVDQLLADPRHAERWARHWMDIWRYSDWAGWNDGGQIRDSQPHLWRWRDWIVESLAADHGYDTLLVDMLAADERAPEDPNALRATGFLARNYKMLSREQWLEDTVNHTGLAFMGLTVGCAKCHDHLQDPLPQKEYFALRAIFEPHQVRLDHVPGEADPSKNGLARVYDADLNAPTWFLPRGDERKPDKEQPILPGVPAFMGGTFVMAPVSLPPAAVSPQKREFVREALVAAAESAVQSAGDQAPLELAKLRELKAVLTWERLEEAGKQDSPEFKEAGDAAVRAQREAALQQALKKVVTATAAANAAVEKKEDPAATTKLLEEARAELDAALAASASPITGPPAPRSLPAYPAQSSGRRLAFARWLTNPQNPLTARVAVNHVWARHFGRGLVATVADFGKGGARPSHPALLDWLSADFMKNGWSLKHLHRTICLSAAYQQSSASGTKAEAKLRDPDNLLLWHFPSRRLEAEAVRDNILYVTGGLDPTMGGPEIDHKLALTSPRRSLYLRCAAEKQAEFLQVFDGPSVVDCYERKPSVMPQQALALLNSSLTRDRARAAAAQWKDLPDDTAFIRHAFLTFLTRDPQPEESRLCMEFLQNHPDRARENLLLTLLNHHEFITLR